MKRILVFVGLCWLASTMGCADRPVGADAPPPSTAQNPIPQSSTESTTVVPATDANATAASESSAAPNSSTAGDSTGASAADGNESVTSNTNSNPSRESKPAAQPGAEQRISFDDLNCGMQADIVFREWMLTERVKELDGQVVRLAGYMHPDAKLKGITEFILLRNTECKFGPSGQADHLIRVTLDKGVTTSFSNKPVEVLGKLTINPFTGPDGKTWSIFDMTGKSVEPFRR